MAGSDGMQIDVPGVLAGADTLAAFAGEFRQAWSASSKEIDAAEADNPFGSGPTRASIDSWYPDARGSLDFPGGRLPTFFDAMATNCRTFTAQYQANDQLLAGQAARVGGQPPSAGTGGRPADPVPHGVDPTGGQPTDPARSRRA